MIFGHQLWTVTVSQVQNAKFVLRYLPEISFSMTAHTEGDHVFEEMCVFFTVFVRLDEPSNRRDVVVIRIATDLRFRFRTDNTRVAIAFERLASGPVPAFPVWLVVAAFPVRMVDAGELLRCPFSTTFIVTHGNFARDLTRISFDSCTAYFALQLSFATVPSWIIRSFDRRPMSPRFRTYTLGTVQPLLV